MGNRRTPDAPVHDRQADGAANRGSVWNVRKRTHASLTLAYCFVRQSVLVCAVTANCDGIGGVNGERQMKYALFYMIGGIVVLLVANWLWYPAP
jgi:hypothetical protein